MRKNDPLKAQFTFSTFFLLADLIYLGVLAFRSSGGAVRILEIVSFFVGLIILTLLIIARTRLGKRADEHIRRALSGDASLLAQPQPQADEHALPLPTTITMQPGEKLLSLFIGIGMAIILVVAFVGFVVADQGHFTIDPAFLLYMGIGIVVTAIVTFAIVWFVTKFMWKRTTRQEIIIQAPGITTYYFGTTTTVLWNDAQCFALCGAKMKGVQAYELIGKNSVVRWTVPKNLRFYYPLQPAEYYEEYSRKIQALPQLITAKTGLPLYDLREKKLIGW
jgi:hypothetical protein